MSFFIFFIVRSNFLVCKAQHADRERSEYQVRRGCRGV